MENINNAREIRLKETITGKIAKKFKEIISKNGEHINLKKDAETNKYLNKFEYNGRELSARTVYQNSEVGDYDIGEGTHCISLGDLAVCPEFFQAIKIVEQEEGINFRIGENIGLNDCLSLIGKQGINFKEIANSSGLRDNNSINTVLLKIKDDLSIFLNPEFEIMLSDLDCSLFIRASGDKKQEVIDKSPLFMNKLQKISKYFDEHMNEIKQSFKNLAEQEQKKNEETKREQEKRAEDLQKQL